MIANPHDLSVPCQPHEDGYADFVEPELDPDLTYALQAVLARAINLAGQGAWSAEIEADEDARAFYNRLAGELARASNEVMRFRMRRDAK